MDFLSFLKDDWQKIPQNLRYFILSGITLIALTWISDHWGSNIHYDFLGWNFRSAFFSMGIALIIVGFCLILAKQIFTYFNLTRLRYKYPIKDLNRTFYLVWFNGRLILFDKIDRKNKRSYHIHPMATAKDLGFASYGIYTPLDFEQQREDLYKSKRI
jgi:hypothetical protein